MKNEFHEVCRAHLAAEWQKVENLFAQAAPNLPANLLSEQALIDDIAASLRSRSKSYRYVLATQLLAKCVDSTLDARYFQSGVSQAGAFNARSMCEAVIVPFDQANQSVLGGSPEPYVSKPLRNTGLFPGNRAAQKYKDEWDLLVRVIEQVEQRNDPAITQDVFCQLLIEIRKLLEGAAVAYPAPMRVSYEGTQRLIQRYVAERSGGDRLEAVVTALLRTVGARFGLFDAVRRAKVNTSDTSSGMAADIECYAGEDLALLVEVKDRDLSVTQFNATLDKARIKRVSEILFVVQRGLRASDEEDIESRIDAEFGAGQNVYTIDLDAFMQAILILLMEKGRVRFIEEVGRELDSSGASIEHRRAWANLLRNTERVR